MKCPVCNGKLYYERLNSEIWAYRCIHCGRLFEEEILMNKIFGPLEKKRKGRKSKYKSLD